MRMLPQWNMHEPPATWEEWRQEHPRMSSFLRMMGVGFSFFLDGHFIVWAGRWIVLTSGRIAEPAMLFATLWITATNVAPELTSKLGGTADTLSALSLMSFSLLPEVILFTAIVTAFHYWREALKNGGDAWIWAILISLPTLTFFGMTVYTIISFISERGHMQQATGLALVLRCLAGWFYSLVGLLHASMTKRGPVSQSGLQQSVHVQSTDCSQQLTEEVHQWMQRVDSRMQQIEASTQQIVSPAPLREQRAESNFSSEPLSPPTTPKEQTNLSPKVTTKLSTKVTPLTGSKNARQAALRFIKKHPDIGASELAQKTGISRQYAARILASVVNE